MQDDILSIFGIGTNWSFTGIRHLESIQEIGDSVPYYQAYNSNTRNSLKAAKAVAAAKLKDQAYNLLRTNTAPSTPKTLYPFKSGSWSDSWSESLGIYKKYI